MAKPRHQERAAKRAAPKKIGKNGSKQPAAAEPAEADHDEDAAPDTLIDPVETPVESAAPDTVDENQGEPESTIEDTRTYLKGLLEALLFVGDRPLELKELARATRIDKKRTEELLQEIAEDYSNRGMHLSEVAGGFAFRSNPLYSDQVRHFLAQRPVRLSRAQLETLSIVAYRQPITRPEIDDIRGVDCGPVLKGLLDRDLVRIIGKKDEPGRPMLYGTTQAFLELFSMSSLQDLPTLREFTELSDESKDYFQTKTGEEAPEGAVEGSESEPGSGGPDDADGERTPEDGAEEVAADDDAEGQAVAEIEASGEDDAERDVESDDDEDEDEEDDDEDDDEDDEDDDDD